MSRKAALLKKCPLSKINKINRLIIAYNKRIRNKQAIYLKMKEKSKIYIKSMK